MNEYLILGSSIPDWLQAIGALVAIIAVIWGWFQFRWDSKEKQNQIDTLTALAKETALQTKEMIESNRIQSDHLKKYEEHFEIIKSSNQREAEKRESEIKLKILEVKPKFKLVNFEEFENGEPTMILGDSYQCILLNEGGKAIITGCKEMELNQFKSSIGNNREIDVENNQQFSFFIQPIPLGF